MAARQAKVASTLPFTAVRRAGEEAGVGRGHAGVDGHAVLRSCVLVAHPDSLRDGVDVPAGGRFRRGHRFGRRRRLFLLFLCRLLCRCRCGCGSRFILRHRRGCCQLFKGSGRCRFSGCRLLFCGVIRILRTHPLDRQRRIRTVLGFFLLLRHFSLVLHRCDNLRRALRWGCCQCGDILCLPAGREQQNALQREQC